MATLASLLAVTVVMAFVLCQDCQAQSTGYVNISYVLWMNVCIMTCCTSAESATQ